MDAARSVVRERVSDAGRREQLLALVSELETVARDQRVALDTFSEKLQRLNAGEDTTRPELQNSIAGFVAEQRARRGHAIDVHLKMASLTDDAEWNAIVDAEKKAFRESGALLEEKP